MMAKFCLRLTVTMKSKVGLTLKLVLNKRKRKFVSPMFSEISTLVSQNNLFLVYNPMVSYFLVSCIECLGLSENSIFTGNLNILYSYTCRDINSGRRIWTGQYRCKFSFMKPQSRAFRGPNIQNHPQFSLYQHYQTLN